MANLGIGIIGCGNISTSYLKLAPLFKGLEVRAVADVNMEAAKTRGAEFGVKAQGVDDLLANKAYLFCENNKAGARMTKNKSLFINQTYTITKKNGNY